LIFDLGLGFLLKEEEAIELREEKRRESDDSVVDFKRKVPFTKRRRI